MSKASPIHPIHARAQLPRHFLTLFDLSGHELESLVRRATELKAMHYEGALYEPLRNRVLGMIFEKSSTRTRVSFEAAMAQCGGNAIFLSPRDTQLGRGERLEDTARVLSRMVDVIMIRTFAHDTVETFAEYSRVPVINALTDLHHPCQLLADMQTLLEYRGAIAGARVAWVGDGNNMCHSYIQAAQRFGFELRVATPTGYDPNPDVLRAGGGATVVCHDAAEAVENADLVVTDVWASMGQEGEQAERMRLFKPFQINAELMKRAAPDALFMHCLPAHRGEEVTGEVIDGPRSVVWDEAENRLHSQKALLEFLLLEAPDPDARTTPPG